MVSILFEHPNTNVQAVAKSTSINCLFTTKLPSTQRPVEVVILSQNDENIQKLPYQFNTWKPLVVTRAVFENGHRTQI